MSEQVTVLVNRPSIFWLPAMREKNEDGSLRPVCDKLMLGPGTNIISRRRWDQSAGHPAVVTHLELGTLKLDPTAEDASAHLNKPDGLTGLREMNIEKATVWIDTCVDVKQLDKWRSVDDRKGIHAAIDARTEELAKAAEANKGNEATGGDEDF